jgi:hypothetical protein
MNGNEAGAELPLRHAQLVLPEGTYVDVKDGNGDTPLNLAIWHDYDNIVEITKLLLKNGADVNTENYWGNTPLSGAAVRGAEEVARVLLENGANPNAPGNHPAGLDMEYYPNGLDPHDHHSVPIHLFTHAFDSWGYGRSRKALKNLPECYSTRGLIQTSLISLGGLLCLRPSAVVT